MENASQALIIAGAILLAILLIAIGMFIFNKANTSIQSAARGMDQNEIAVFNGKLNAYQGTISGTQLKALIQIVGQINAENEANGSGPEKYVGFKATSAVNPQSEFVKTVGSNYTWSKTGNPKPNLKSSSVMALTNKVKDLEKFEVTFTYDAGLIVQIDIAQK